MMHSLYDDLHLSHTCIHTYGTEYIDISHEKSQLKRKINSYNAQFHSRVLSTSISIFFKLCKKKKKYILSSKIQKIMTYL